MKDTVRRRHSTMRWLLSLAQSLIPRSKHSTEQERQKKHSKISTNGSHLKKSYDLYKTFHEYRRVVPKPDRFTIFEKSESTILEVIECIMQASSESKKEKLPTLERASIKLNMPRVFIRLMKDVKTIDGKKYMNLESVVDEIGRMLGGWIRSIKTD